MSFSVAKDIFERTTGEQCDVFRDVCSEANVSTLKLRGQRLRQALLLRRNLSWMSEGTGKTKRFVMKDARRSDKRRGI
jgi:hypothetical protein